MKLRRHVAVWVAALLVAGGSRLEAQTITSLVPSVGSTYELIEIRGTSFYQTPGGVLDPVVEVQFNGVSAGFYISANTLIFATNPPGASTGFVRVRKAAGGWVNSPYVFTQIGPEPYIASFSPSMGSQGDQITIYGLHFTNATAVRFNGTNAPGFYISGYVDRYTKLQVNAPTNVTTGPISVEHAGVGTNSTSSNFFVQPVITGFSPTKGRLGTNVVITGKNFLGATSVTFGGQPASFQTNGNTQIIATVPDNAPTGEIVVSSPAGPDPSGSNFVVLPTITGFSPNFGGINSSVVITGRNLFGITSIKFNDVTASFNGGSVTYSQVTATAPNSTTGPISITTTNGGHTNSACFYYRPRITSFTPTNGAPQTTVELAGVNFLDATNVSFGGASASFSVINNTNIQAFVPSNVITGPISVSTPGGTTNTGASLFYGPPGITSFNPTSGLPGTNVFITGSNFLGVTAVLFNGLAATIVSNNNTTIRAVVTNGTTTGPITVVAPGGSAISAQNFVLNYTADMGVIVTDLPDPVFVGSNLTYTIQVVNYGPFAAAGVTLSNTLPPTVNLISNYTTAGTINTNGNPITANLGNINVGNQVTLTLVVVPQVTGLITNSISVTNSYPDPASANDTTKAVTLVQPLPLLSIQIVNTNRVRVAWPVALTNYALEFKPLLATTNFWSNVALVPLTNGNERYVTETNLSTMKYYRLRK